MDCVGLCSLKMFSEAYAWWLLPSSGFSAVFESTPTILCQCTTDLGVLSFSACSSCTQAKKIHLKSKLFQLNCNFIWNDSTVRGKRSCLKRWPFNNSWIFWFYYFNTAIVLHLENKQEKDVSIFIFRIQNFYWLSSPSLSRH